jgi:hypothetical protein
VQAAPCPSEDTLGAASQRRKTWSAPGRPSGDLRDLTCSYVSCSDRLVLFGFSCKSSHRLGARHMRLDSSYASRASSSIDQSCFSRFVVPSTWRQRWTG